MKRAFHSLVRPGLLAAALTACAQDSTKEISAEPGGHSPTSTSPTPTSPTGPPRATADVPTLSTANGLVLQNDSTKWRPPTDNSRDSLKRVPPTLYRLSPSSKRWAALEDYQRWFREFLERGEHPLEFYSSSVKRLDSSIFDIQPGDTIADIGCGTGTLEINFLTREVPFKKFYAVDIDKESLDFLDFALKTSKMDPENRVELVHSTLTDVGLPENSIDVMVVLYTRLFPASVSDQNAHGSAEYNALFDTIKKALKPGARFHMVDSMGQSHGPAATPLGGGLRDYEPKQVSEWMKSLGFELTSQNELSDGAIGEREYHLAFRLME